MELVLDARSTDYVCNATLPPKRELRKYRLELNDKTEEHVLTQRTKHGAAVVGVFSPIKGQRAVGNVLGLRAELKLEANQAFIKVQDKS